MVAISSLALSRSSAFAADYSSGAGIVSTSSTPLNVRSAASTSSSVVTTLPKGGYVTLISKSGSWWRVEYAEGKYGYCSESYIKKLSDAQTKKVTLSSGFLNVRSGAGTNYGVISTLPNGKTVITLSTSGLWNKILYNGTKTGYVSGAYLSSAPSEEKPANSSISLSVPSYKQTDGRWSSVYLGSSGKTIGAIGCTTTALAMTESYRTKSVIYPDAMSKKLVYSQSGSLYWPSNYAFSTNPSGYLDMIYSLLKKGKPVIIGAKTASGSQHWVVVKGFAGGEITASNFTINDPGSNTRTTLQAFFSSYPIFYKIAYYNISRKNICSPVLMPDCI